jgi:hypothetical protein
VYRVCAWCGVAMGQVSPYEDTAVTHGICDRCFNRVQTGRDLPPPTPLPPGHVLLVVAREARPLFWHLRSALEDLAGIAVVLDRRIHERRQNRTKIAANRRTASRRRAIASRDSLPATFGVWIVRSRG